MCAFLHYQVAYQLFQFHLEKVQKDVPHTSVCRKNVHFDCFCRGVLNTFHFHTNDCKLSKLLSLIAPCDCASVRDEKEPRPSVLFCLSHFVRTDRRTSWCLGSSHLLSRRARRLNVLWVIKYLFRFVGARFQCQFRSQAFDVRFPVLFSSLCSTSSLSFHLTYR